MYVSNPVAVDSFTSSPTQIVVTAKTAGLSSLILWDEAGESASYLVFSDLDVASLQKEIHEALPYDNIQVEAELDRVSLSGTVLSDASAEAAGKLAALYAKVVVNSVVVRPPHIRQVRLQVEIVEIDRSKVEQFGINLFSYGKNQSNVTTGQFPSTQIYTPATGSHASTLTSSNPLNLLFYNFGLNIGLALQDLQREIDFANSCRAGHYYAERTEGLVSGRGRVSLSCGSGWSGRTYFHHHSVPALWGAGWNLRRSLMRTGRCS